jgi:hypothetical protein
MRERGQATVEYAGIGLVALALLLMAAGTAATKLGNPPSGDAAALDLARRHVPTLLLERGAGDELPVDFRRCRRPDCARSPEARPVLFLHAVHTGGFTYLEYWEYLPDSRAAHTGVEALDGYHRDDWEGVIVKLRPDGSVVGARASAHLGWNGRRPWWQLAADDWAPYPAPVYRASGSHAGSFTRSGIDLAGDGWSGTARRVTPELVPADRARTADARFDPGSVPPWEKQAWSDPEATITGRPGDRAVYARYARWWAWLCRPCRTS